MKKIILLLLLMPIIVFGKEECVVKEHVINSNVEIAGGLNVEELIIVDGDCESFERKLNYYSFGDTAWNKKDDVNFEGSEFYNGYNLTVSKVGYFTAPKDINLNNLSNGLKEELPELDIKKLSDNTYVALDSKTGFVNVKFNIKTSGNYAYYINYTVGNAIVKHSDIKELNYTFKNLFESCKKTIFRLITPYPVEKKDQDLYNLWLHGNNNAEFQLLTNENEEQLGIYGIFYSTGKEQLFNVRMTLPQDYVGIDMNLNNSKIEALDKVLEVESNRKKNTSKAKKILKNSFYGVIVASGILTIGVALFIVLKYYDKKLFIISLIFAGFIDLFNYLFNGFKYWYMFFVLLIPIIGFILNNILLKVKSKSKVKDELKVKSKSKVKDESKDKDKPKAKLKAKPKRK